MVPGEAGCENQNDSAVGDTIREINRAIDNGKHFVNCKYAFTITPSPYKKHDGTSYKLLDNSAQKELIIKALENGLCSIESIHFELTQKGSIHAHGVLTTLTILALQDDLVSKLGYAGKHNKPSDTVLFKEIFDSKGWKTYCTKSKVWTWDEIFEVLSKDIDNI